MRGSRSGIIRAPTCRLGTAMLSKGFLPATLPADPMPLFEQWFDGARHAKAQPNPDAMALATTTLDARPSVRIVLCKKLIPAPGYLVFFTNYDSRKGAELAANPRASAVFHWDAFGRQVRVVGPVKPMTAEAMVLAACDDLDAKLQQVRQHLADDTSPGLFTAYHRYLERVLLKPR